MLFFHKTVNRFFEAESSGLVVNLIISGRYRTAITSFVIRFGTTLVSRGNNTGCTILFLAPSEMSAKYAFCLVIAIYLEFREYSS